jgi:hypothetical protein
MRVNLNRTRIGHDWFDHGIVQDNPNIIRDLIEISLEEIN